jgi:cytochrome b6-f complex iron-sulfur subunit
MKLIRREFLNKLGIGSLIALFAGQFYMWIRSLFPNVSYGKLRRVKIGNPQDIPEGMTFRNDLKVYIFRERNTFHAISAVCTHLGCTVNHVNLSRPKTVRIGDRDIEVRSEFHCPCHGSKFYGEGTNYTGPAPRPLDWIELEVASEDGKLVVDLDRKTTKNFKLTV